MQEIAKKLGTLYDSVADDERIPKDVRESLRDKCWNILTECVNMHCRTCKHWKNKGVNYGPCFRVKTGVSIDGVDVPFNPVSSFGCIYFEKLEEGEKDART